MNALRYVAVAEATSWIALIVATVVKHTDNGDAGVTILGPIHGALFLAYVVLTLMSRVELKWSNRTTFVVLACSIVPFGGFAVERKLARETPAAA